MDGNRRFARARGMSVRDGHAAGARKLHEVVHWAQEIVGCTDLFFYTLSTENWKRSSQELEHLLLLVELFFRTHANDMMSENVRIKIAGQRSKFSKKIQQIFSDLEERTKNNTGLTVWFGLSYGGRAEILEGLLRLQEAKVVPTEESLKAVLWTADLPDPDLIIRTGGEKRLSNFLTWGSVYSELFFSDTLWPAFTKEELHAILEEYNSRERRRGA